MRWSPVWTAASLLLGALGSVSAFEITDGKVSVSTLDGSSRLSKSFTSSAPLDLPSPLSLDADEVLRVNFVIKGESAGAAPASSDDADGSTSVAAPKAKLPHQVFALLSDSLDPNVVETIQVPVKKASGKASFSIRLDRLQPTLLTSSGKVSLHLLLASFDSTKPVSYPIAMLQLPAALLRSPDDAPTPRRTQEKEQGFLGWEERRHTFATPASETMPSRFLSLSISVATVAFPWVVLLGLIGALPLELGTLTAKRGLLLGTLVYLELLASRYWLGGSTWTLFHMLPWLLVGGAVALFAGRGALGELRKERLAGSASLAPAQAAVSSS